MNEWIIAVGIFTVVASAGLEFITQQAVSDFFHFHFHYYYYTSSNNNKYDNYIHAVANRNKKMVTSLVQSGSIP